MYIFGKDTGFLNIRYCIARNIIKYIKTLLYFYEFKFKLKEEWLADEIC